MQNLGNKVAIESTWKAIMRHVFELQWMYGNNREASLNQATVPEIKT